MADTQRNVPFGHEGEPVLMKEEEKVARVEKVELDVVCDQQEHPKSVRINYSEPGALFLTSYRLIFVGKGAQPKHIRTDEMASLSIPIHRIKELTFDKKAVGSSKLTGIAQVGHGSGLAGDFRFRISFKSSGAQDMYDSLLDIRERQLKYIERKRAESHDQPRERSRSHSPSAQQQAAMQQQALMQQQQMMMMQQQQQQAVMMSQPMMLAPPQQYPMPMMMVPVYLPPQMAPQMQQPPPQQQQHRRH